MRTHRRSIKFLVLFLLTFAMLGTFGGSVISSAIVNKNNLQKNYLIENQYYAQKLADTTDLLFHNMFQNLLTYSKNKTFISSDKIDILRELEEIQQSTNFFNSTIFVDSTGKLVSAAPDIGMDGSLLNTDGPKEALKRKEALISEPYIGIIGKLMVLISVPVYDENNQYVGFLGGTIYLHEENSLKTVLGQHPEHKNDSYVFVVDKKGNIIYHPDSKRINDNVLENEMVRKVVQGNRGSQEVVNTKGVSMLAGYAPLASTSHWGIVSQTPKKSVSQPTIDVVRQISLITIPFMITLFVLSFFMLKRIVNPIRDLASYASQINENHAGNAPYIPEKYFELVDLKKAILIAVEHYQKKVDYAENKSNLDPLTEVYNRRALEKTVQDLENYSIILFDIDNFKDVNDSYGHQIGDKVLIFLTQRVKSVIRDYDTCFRLGGDEFLIILPNTDINDAKEIAERLKNKLKDTISPCGETISISMGIGSFPELADSFSELYKITDQALYQSKQEKNTKIVVAKAETVE